MAGFDTGKEEHTAFQGNQVVSLSQARQAMHTALSQITSEVGTICYLDTFCSPPLCVASCCSGSRKANRDGNFTYEGPADVLRVSHARPTRLVPSQVRYAGLVLHLANILPVVYTPKE